MTDLSFTIDRDTFTNAIGWVARTLPSRPLNPILGGIRLTTDTADGGLVLQAFDYEVSAAMRAAAEVHARGESLVSGRLLAAISRALPREPVTVRHEGSMVRIRCGTADFTLPTMNAQDFPELPMFPAATGTIDAEAFAEAAAQTVIAASRDEALMQISCVCLEFTDPDTLTMWATDKHRIAMRRLPWTPAGNYPQGARLLIPVRAVNEIGRLGGDQVTLAFDGNILGIDGGDKRTTTALIAAEFPNCGAVIAKEHTSIATIDVAEVAAALQRAILLDEQDFPRVKLEFESGMLTMAGGKDGIGAISEDISIENYGEAIALWINPKYLLDGLNALRADKAYIGFAGARRPLALVAHDGSVQNGVGPFPGLLDTQPNYLHLVMPTAGDVRA